MNKKLRVAGYTRVSTLEQSREGIRVGLQKLFNDQNEEVKLLVSQLEVLRNHILVNFYS